MESPSISVSLLGNPKIFNNNNNNNNNLTTRVIGPYTVRGLVRVHQAKLGTLTKVRQARQGFPGQGTPGQTRIPWSGYTRLNRVLWPGYTRYLDYSTPESHVLFYSVPLPAYIDDNLLYATMFKWTVNFSSILEISQKIPGNIAWI